MEATHWFTHGIREMGAWVSDLFHTTPETLAELGNAYQVSFPQLNICNNCP